MLKPDVKLSNVIGLTPVANILLIIDSVPIFKTSYHFLINPVLLTILENKSVLKLKSSFAKWSYSSIITYIGLSILNSTSFKKFANTSEGYLLLF